MSAYFVVELEVTNPAAMEPCASRIALSPLLLLRGSLRLIS
jgi:hypothetical protein